MWWSHYVVVTFVGGLFKWKRPGHKQSCGIPSTSAGPWAWILVDRVGRFLADKANHRIEPIRAWTHANTQGGSETCCDRRSGEEVMKSKSESKELLEVL